MKTVIIGNSAAGLAAAKSFRKYNKVDEVTIVSKEGGLAYSRVLLPYILRGRLDYGAMYIKDKGFYLENNIDYVEKEVVEVDSKERRVKFSDNTDLAFDKLIIASGSYAVAPPIEGLKAEGICHMWTKADLDKLMPLFESKRKVVVIGSGFVALQGAWAAKYKGLDVTIIEIMDRIMPNVLDEEGAKLLAEKIKGSGVTLNTGTVTEKVEKLADGSFRVCLKDREDVYCDFVIVGTGVRCNIDFLNGSGIECDRAVLVDRYMSTNFDGIYAVGDVAAGPTAFGDSHKVHALWPTAIEMGEVAGANAAGKKIEYRGSLNMNVTQMYNMTVASMGLFNNEEIDNYHIFSTKDCVGYLKVCYKDEYVVGACLVGSSEPTKLFGKLRTIIRKKIKTDCEPSKLESYLDIKIFKDRI